MKLQSKIVIPVLTLLLFSTIFVTALSYFQAQKGINQIVGNFVDSALDTLTDHIEHTNQIISVVDAEMYRKNKGFTYALAEMVRLHSAGGTLDLDDVSLFENIADILGMSEINVTDRQGTIVGSNLIDNYGFNYGDADSTREYLKILDTPGYEIMEEPRTSAVSGDTYQYGGTGRTDGPGFVQAGLAADVIKQYADMLDVTNTAANIKVGTYGHTAIIRNDIYIYST